MGSPPRFRPYLDPEHHAVPGAFVVLDGEGQVRGRVSRTPEGWQALVRRVNGDLEAIGMSRTRALAGAAVLRTYRSRVRVRSSRRVS